MRYNREERKDIRRRQKRFLRRAGGAVIALSMVGMAIGLITSSVLWSQRVDELQREINLYPNITSLPMWNSNAGYNTFPINQQFTGNQIQCLGQNPDYGIPSVQNCNLTYVRLGESDDSWIGPSIQGYYTITAYKNKTLMSAGIGAEFFYASSTFNYANPYVGGGPFTATQMSVLIPNAIPAPYRPLTNISVTGTAASNPVTTMVSTQYQAIIWIDGAVSIGMTFGDTGIPATDGGWKIPVTRFDWILPALT